MFSACSKLHSIHFVFGQLAVIPGLAGLSSMALGNTGFGKNSIDIIICVMEITEKP